MSAQTPIYGITYPTDSDLVRDIADHLKTEAQTVETALHEVDQRATPAGSTPVIAQTFDQLSQMSGVTGQTGYVTNDASYRNGVYIHDIAGWERASDTLGDDLFEFVDNDGWSHDPNVAVAVQVSPGDKEAQIKAIFGITSKEV